MIGRGGRRRALNEDRGWKGDGREWEEVDAGKMGEDEGKYCRYERFIDRYETEKRPVYVIFSPRDSLCFICVYLH